MTTILGTFLVVVGFAIFCSSLYGFLDSDPPQVALNSSTALLVEGVGITIGVALLTVPAFVFMAPFLAGGAWLLMHAMDPYNNVSNAFKTLKSFLSSLKGRFSMSGSDKKQFATFAEKKEYYESGDVTVSMSEGEEDLSLEDEIKEVLGEFFSSVSVTGRVAECYINSGQLLVRVKFNTKKWTLEVEDDCNLTIGQLKNVAGRLSRYFDVEIDIQV